MKTIVVNNPAAKSGGALTILIQFIENAKKYDLENKYIYFVSLKELKKYEDEKVKIIVLKDIIGVKRVVWDYFGLRNWCKKNNINPNKIISLQNTGVNYKGIDQIIYEHQSLIFLNKKLNFLNKDERKYWLYKNIYPIFIKSLINKNTTLITQSEWMKSNFEILLKNIQYKEIKIYEPTINLSSYSFELEKIKIDEEKINLFYPASAEVLKNHIFLIEVVKQLKQSNIEAYKRINILLTFNESQRRDLKREVEKYDLQDCIKFIGIQTYNQVVNYYKKIDYLIFPSIIESFPLPLIEANSLNKKILVAEEQYSKYLCEDNNVIRIKLNICEWVKVLENLKKQNQRVKEKLIGINGWKNFFNENILNDN